MGTTLIVRNSARPEPTEAGTRLLRHCQIRHELETTLIEEIQNPKCTHQLAGVLRIAGFSSILRSIVMPSLSHLLRENSGIKFEMINLELYEIPSALKTLRVDFALTQDPISASGVTSRPLGFEDYVLVKPRKKVGADPSSFLDHDPNDQTTLKFWKIQKTQPSTFRRTYLDEVYAVLDGVKLGWGQAVLPRHLVQGDPDLKVESKFKTLRLPVTLNYLEQPYFSPLQTAVVETLVREISKRLSR